MKKENKKNELTKIDVIINGYKFSILENHPSNKSKYRIVHSGVYPEGVQFGANYVYNTIDKAIKDIHYYTLNSNTFQIRKEGI
jgi:hypothetical protein